MESSRYPELGYTPCENGFAAGVRGDVNNTFKCNNVSMNKSSFQHDTNKDID
jgi:hypothetical protein